MAKSKTIQKVYSIRVDNEVKGTYSTDIASFTLLAESAAEALDQAEMKLKDYAETAVIGKVEMLHVIS